MKLENMTRLAAGVLETKDSLRVAGAYPSQRGTAKFRSRLLSAGPFYVMEVVT